MSAKGTSVFSKMPMKILRKFLSKHDSYFFWKRRNIKWCKLWLFCQVGQRQPAMFRWKQLKINAASDTWRQVNLWPQRKLMVCSAVLFVVLISMVRDRLSDAEKTLFESLAVSNHTNLTVDKVDSRGVPVSYSVLHSLSCYSVYPTFSAIESLYLLNFWGCGRCNATECASS